MQQGQKDFINKVIAAVIVIAVLGGVVALLIYAFKFFLLVFGGILFGVLLRAATNQLHRLIPIKKGIVLLIVVVLLLGFLFGVGSLLVPTVNAQIEGIKERLPQALEKLESTLVQYEWGQQIVDEVKGESSGIFEGRDIGEAVGLVSSTVGVLTDIIIVIVFGIFFAADPKTYMNGIVSLSLPKYRPRLRDVIYMTYKTLAFWLLGKLVAMIFVGVLVGVIMAIIGVPLAFGLGVISFFLNFINMVGPILSAIPAVLLAFLESPTLALYTALAFLVIQQVESYVILPMVYKKTVNISPIITLAAIVFFGIIAGFLGVVMAVPLVAALKVIITELYVKDYLQNGKEKEEITEG